MSSSPSKASPSVASSDATGAGSLQPAPQSASTMAASVSSAPPRSSSSTAPASDAALADRSTAPPSAPPAAFASSASHSGAPTSSATPSAAPASATSVGAAASGVHSSGDPANVALSAGVRDEKASPHQSQAPTSQAVVSTGRVALATVVTSPSSAASPPLATAAGSAAPACESPMRRSDVGADGLSSQERDLLEPRVWGVERDRMISDLGTLAGKVSDRRLEASLHLVQVDHNQAKVTIDLAERQVASLTRRVRALEAELEGKAPAPEPTRPAEIDALHERAKTAEASAELVKESRDALVAEISDVRAKHSAETARLESKIASLVAELERFKPLGDSPEQISAREQRMRAVMTLAVVTARVYDRSLREYEAALAPLVLGYDRRGRVVESFFQVASGDSPDIQGRLPRAMAAVFPDLLVESDNRDGSVQPDEQ
ncbi:hypothetical protein PINS_up017679, partial [Pythium insidiosum]